MDFLNNLRSKSSSVKTHYALAIAGVVTAIIGLFWLTTLSHFVPEVEQVGGVAQQETFSDFIGETQEQVGNVIEATKEGTELFNQVSEVLEQGESLQIDAGDVPSPELQGALGSINERHTSLESEPESPFAQKSSPSIIGTSTNTVATTTEKEWEVWEKHVLIETTKNQPKKILIGTSSSPKIE